MSTKKEWFHLVDGPFHTQKALFTPGIQQTLTFRAKGMRGYYKRMQEFSNTMYWYNAD